MLDWRIVLVAAAVAAALWLFVPALRGAEAARRLLGTHRVALASVLTVLLVNALLTLPVADSVRQQGLTVRTFAAAALGTGIPLFLVPLLRGILPGAITWADLGLRPLPVSRTLGTGLQMGVAALVASIVVGLVLQQLGLRQNQLEGQFSFVRGAAPDEFLAIVVLGAGVAPFVEELFFRGYLFGLYARRQPLWVAYLASGLLFALPHVNPLTSTLAENAGLVTSVFVLGSLLAWTYRRTGSLIPAIVAHSFNNGVALVAFYSVGSGA